MRIAGAGRPGTRRGPGGAAPGWRSTDAVGIKNFWLARALHTRGLTCVGWSARGLERRRGDVEAVAARATRGLAPGAILLLHEGPRVPAAIRVHAIRRVLERLREQGYQCVVPGPEQLV